MTASSDKPSREERLAAKLRENLRRRKAQGREAAGNPAAPPGGSQRDPLSKLPDGG